MKIAEWRLAIFGWLFSVGCWLLAIGCFGPLSARADSQQLYLQCLTNFETYAESIWHTASYTGAPTDSGYWGDGGSTGNGGIRGSSGVALAYAVLVVAQPTDPKTSNRLARIRQALNYNNATHVTGTNNTVAGNRWGWSGVSTDWQTPEWAGSMALACILVQSNLPAATVDGVRRVVVSEADHRASIPPASGYISDTKAEENGWQGNILALAAAWMSTSNNAPTWLNAAKSYLVNTYTVPNTAGDPLAAWVTTQTLFPSFALENHNFYHPTYEMVAGMSSGDSLLMARLANTNVANDLQIYAEHNVMTVWHTNLAAMLLDSGEFAYPSGLDWELHDYEQNSYITWIASHFNDPLARWTDERLAQLVRYRQIVNGNGTFVGPSSGGFFREAVEARRTAIAWLHWATADFPSGPTNAPGPSIDHFADVEIIAHRSPSAFVSISYGNSIMGMIDAASGSFPTNVYIATPALPGIFGHGPLGNPTSASLLSLTTNSNGFAAQLLVQNGANGSTRVYVNSTGESVGIVEVPLPASGVTGTSAGCFTNGIENDPLTGGTRLVEWTGNSAIFTNFSNVGRSITNSWLCISGRYGMAAGPGGYFRYRAVANYNRPGAAQDYLSFIPQAPLPARYAVWFPNRNAAQTSSLASQISWTTNGGNAVLSFPGTGGSNYTITASLATGNGTWSADANGNWSDPSKWSGGNVADGAGFSADFSTLNLTADRVVTLDSPRSISTLRFSDTAGAQSWTLNSSGASALTLAGSPSIVVTQSLATITAPIAGVAGFTKTGAGTLALGGTNSLSGTINLDSNSTSANDGALRILTSAALMGVTTLVIRNNTGPVAASTLQLDGSSESIEITQDLTASCRANVIPTIQNLAGNNTFSGDVLMQVGGSNIVVQTDSGVLVLSGELRYIGSFTTGRSWNFFGPGETRVTGPILESVNGAPISVGKFSAGLLTLRGTNTFDGAINLNAGILNFAEPDNLGAPTAIINFNGGTLQYAPGNTADISGRTLMFNNAAAIDTGANSVAFAGGIGGGGPGSLTKTGSGALTLNGANAYSGQTIVSAGTFNINGSLGSSPVSVVNGTLGGAGTIDGPVTVSPGGTLAPGNNGFASLTINNALTNSGVLSLQLNKAGSSLTNDTIKGLSTVAYGGALQLIPSGGQVAVGDSFKLFYATNYRGAFASLNPTTPGPGLAWNTNSLGVNGTLTVALGAVNPRITQVALVGTNFVWSGTGGAAASGFAILSSTNLALPLTNWAVIGTGVFDNNGNFAATNGITPNSTSRFYLIRLP